MKFKVDKLFVVISIIVGIFLGVILEIPYQIYTTATAVRIVPIMMYMTIFALIVGIVLLFKGLINGTYVNFGKIMALTLAAFIGFSGFSGLFEFLYELGDGIKKSGKGSQLQYVFLVDDSGSMDTNDPHNQRYDAVEQIIRNMDPTDQFAVYRFADDTVCTTPMGSINSKDFHFDKTEYDGVMTALFGAINTAINDVAESSKKYTKIIVLTDGIPSDTGFGNFRYNNLISTCIDENVSISSVGFGNPDTSYLTDLATNTGGVFVYANDIASLAQNLETVVKTQTAALPKDRDLLGFRMDSTGGSFLYGFLRVLFLILLGALWTIVKMLLVGEKKYTTKGMVSSLIMCSVAALLCELLLTVAGFNSTFVRILFCALWACTIIPNALYQKPNLGNSLTSSQGGNTGMSLSDDFNAKSKGVGGPKSFF